MVRIKTIKSEFYSNMCELGIDNKKVNEIENALLYNCRINYLNSNIYMNIIFSCIKNSKIIIDDINNDKINKDNICLLNIKELSPENLNFQHKEINIDDYIPTCTIYCCPKCDNNICSVISRQDRSADEGMTDHITCIKCKHYWKEN